ncbi:hypothetical protein IWW38_006154, partial [Coemansia aciculifera]
HPELGGACRLLLSTGIETAQLATIMAIINATASSREFLKCVVNDDVRSKILELLLDFKPEMMQNFAAKGLVALVYSDFAQASWLVSQGLLPYLDKLCAKYRAAFGLFFARDSDAVDDDEEDDDDGGERSAVLVWANKRMGEYMSPASVLFSALQVYLSELERDHAHYFESSLAADAVAAVASFQMCLLAQISAYIMHVFDFGKNVRDCALESQANDDDLIPRTLAALRKPPALHCDKAEWARAAVNCFVATYYMRSNPSDPHLLAATEDAQRIVCKGRPIAKDADVSASKNHQWSAYVSDESPSSQQGGDKDVSAAPVFAGDMRNPRLRCTLPILRAALATLADSLEPGLA